MAKQAKKAGYSRSHSRKTTKREYQVGQAVRVCSDIVNCGHPFIGEIVEINGVMYQVKNQAGKTYWLCGAEIM